VALVEVLLYTHMLILTTHSLQLPIGYVHMYIRLHPVVTQVTNYMPLYRHQLYHYHSLILRPHLCQTSHDLWEFRLLMYAFCLIEPLHCTHTPPVLLCDIYTPLHTLLFDLFSLSYSNHGCIIKLFHFCSKSYFPHCSVSILFM